jgi:hypothetical protein
MAGMERPHCGHERKLLAGCSPFIDDAAQCGEGAHDTKATGHLLSLSRKTDAEARDSLVA